MRRNANAPRYVTDRFGRAVAVVDSTPHGSNRSRSGERHPIQVCASTGRASLTARPRLLPHVRCERCQRARASSRKVPLGDDVLASVLITQRGGFAGMIVIVILPTERPHVGPRER